MIQHNLLVGLLLATGIPAGSAIAADSTAAASDQVPAGYEKTVKYLQRARAMQPNVISPEMHVFKLADDVWMHRSYISMGDQRLHANGLLFITEDGITIIDAPWTPIASYDLLDWLDSEFEQPVSRLVITHAHEDRLGGIDPFVERNTPIYGSQATADLARQRGWYAPNYIFDHNLLLRSADHAIELLYPGAGHTDDNIVVWVPAAGVLFGGCLVKSAHAGSLGFTGDANEQAWPASLQRVVSRYPEAKLFIPGHGLPGDHELIDNTLELLED